MILVVLIVIAAVLLFGRENTWSAIKVLFWLFVVACIAIWIYFAPARKAAREEAPTGYVQ